MYIHLTLCIFIKIIVACMGGQGAPNQHVFVHLIPLYKSLNFYVFVTIFVVLLQIHQSYMKLSCHNRYKYHHFCIFHILEHPLYTMNHVYEDYLTVEIPHNKKFFDCTKWNMLITHRHLMNFRTQLLKYLQTAGG